MATQTVTLDATFRPGRGAVAGSVPIGAGTIVEYDDTVYSDAGSAIAGLTARIYADGALVILGGQPPPIARVKSVRFNDGSGFTGLSSIDLFCEQVAVEVDPDTLVVWHTTPEGVELLRPI